MKHMLSLALLALAFTASAFAQTKIGNATITGYPTGIYSASEIPAVSEKVGDVEEKILADLSGFKGNVVLTINVYGNADETGKNTRTNEDIGEDRAEEVAKALAGPFDDLHNVTVRALPHTNGTKYKERSAQVYWSIASAPAPLPAAQPKNSTATQLLFGMAAAVVIVLLALLLGSVIFRKSQKRKRGWVHVKIGEVTYRGILTPRTDSTGNVVGWETPFEGENHFRERFDQAKLAFKSSIKKSGSDPGYRVQLDRLRTQGKIKQVASEPSILA